MSVSTTPATRLTTNLAAWSALLNVDFCPWANRWVYWLKHPLWCLVAALAVSIACALLVNPQLWIVTGALALVLAAGIGWPWLTIRGVTCELEFEGLRGRVGQPITVRLRTTNRWPWPAWGIVLERGFHAEDATSAGIALARLPGWWRGEFEWSFIPTRRGVYPLEAPTIVTGCPFGIWSASKPASVVNQLIVWPRTAYFAGLPDASESRPGALRLTDRRAGDLGERLGTRRFQQGDALRRVHWGQTARHGELIVSELQAPAIAAVQIAIDVDADAHRTAELPTTATLEPTIEAGASICESLVRQHAVVRCTFADQQFRVASPNELRSLMDALAHVPAAGTHCADARQSPRSVDSDTSLRIIITTELGRQRRGGACCEQHQQRMIVVRSSDECRSDDRRPDRRSHRECSHVASVNALAAVHDEWRRICRG